MPPFGKPDDSADKPKVTDSVRNATDTTSPGTVGDTEGVVSDDEAEALDGASGPNRTPAFMKRDGEDENVQLTDTDDLQSAKTGAAAQSPSQVDLVGLEAAAAAGDVREGAEDEIQFTSTPISKLRIGRFQFENGVLRVKSDEAEEFRNLLRKAAIRTQQVVREIDRRGGEAVARRFLESTKSRSTSGTDTSDRGVQAPRPQREQA